jgi:hypothetical protein
MGRVSRDSQPGDIIVIFLGGKTPYLLRKYPSGDKYYLVGECYIHGMIEGEAMEQLEKGHRLVEKFTIW